MRLSELLPRLDGATLTGPGSVQVDTVCHDSRTVRPAALFAAMPGLHHHGLDFLDAAIDAGAAAVLTDRERPAAVSLPWILSPLPRRHMALAAWAVAGDPHSRLRLFGVTGTNGKTTVAGLLAEMLRNHGVRTALFGTVSHELPDGQVGASRTTPEATDLARHLGQVDRAGWQAAVMEVSSHAIALDRVAGLRFEAAVFTNLSRDHLDYHADMEEYFQTKSRLFGDEFLAGGRRVLPANDPWAARLLQTSRPGDVTWGAGCGDVRAEDVSLSLDGCAFTLVSPGGAHAARLGLVGSHNLANAVAAAAAAHGAGVGAEAICTALAAARPVPGRLERIATGLPFPVFVDYAHTPEGLRTVLAALREVTDRRLLVVFGAGGDRDRGKRRPMGEAVGELAHLAIVTSDNPRSEDPAAIAEAVAAGVRAAGAEPEVVLDRRQAIARALRLADERCLVLVAGKGHEQTQTIGTTRTHFCDRETVEELAREAACA